MNVCHRILLIEEDFNEVLQLERAFHEAQITNPIQIARRSEEAICYLKGVGIYANRLVYPLPALIILGLKMRDGMGFTLLKWIRSHPPTRAIPIVAISSIKDTGEIQEAYDLGVNAFFQKGKNLAELVELIQELEMVQDIWQLST